MVGKSQAMCCVAVTSDCFEVTGKNTCRSGLGRR